MPERPSSRPTDRETGRASEIAPGVYVGGKLDAVRFSGAKICVRDEPPDATAGAALHLPIYDSARDAPVLENLDRVADRVSEARSRGEAVLIFCGHGVRRGPLAGAWYLHRVEQIPLEQAFARIEAVRPQIERPRAWMQHAADLDRSDRPRDR